MENLNALLRLRCVIFCAGVIFRNCSLGRNFPVFVPSKKKVKYGKVWQMLVVGPISINGIVMCKNPQGRIEGNSLDKRSK